MPFDSNDLGARIAWLCEALRTASPETLDTACLIAREMLIEAGHPDTATIERLIDGILWGLRAARICEHEGGALVRILTPGGGALTHQYRHTASDLQLARLARMIEDRLTSKVAS